MSLRNTHWFFCKPLKTIITAMNIFNLVKSLFSTNNIPLQAMRSIGTEGAPDMLEN